MFMNTVFESVLNAWNGFSESMPVSVPTTNTSWLAVRFTPDVAAVPAPTIHTAAPRIVAAATPTIALFTTDSLVDRRWRN